MTNKFNPYFEFIRYCLGDYLPIPASIHNIDWDALFAFMRQQALTGVGYCGIERLKKEGVDIPKPIFMKWYALSEKIRTRNIHVNECCVRLIERLKKDGFCSCILKGQGNAILYSNPYARTSGDIDVFVMKKELTSIKERRKIIIDYVRKILPQTKMRYQHIDFPVFKDVSVEMHFIPTAKNNPIYNRRIQHWAENQMFQQCHNTICLPNKAGAISVPTPSFNLIYQLSHLMHHFFDEGIGLRQMLDYYLVLKQQPFTTNIEDCQSSSNRENTNRKNIYVLQKELRYLGLYNFAGAVMYVMHEVFGLEKERMIVPLDTKRGKTLMTEILKGGNFGRYSGLTNHSTGMKYFLKIRRNLQFVCEYPAEALCEPIFRTWHFFWRLWNK